MRRTATPPDRRRTESSNSDGQTAVLRFLSEPAAYGLAAAQVERIDTHGAIVFLAADRAYKVKRAVAYPYMDFSTLERRRRCCLNERAVNSRTAPDLYLDVVPVTRTDGKLALGGDGEVVEWVVVMRRFDQEALLSRLAENGELTSEMMTAVAETIASFHDAATPRRRRAAGSAAMTWVVRENGAEFAERGDIFDPDEAAHLGELGLAQLERHAGLLDARAEDGAVRLCHGDLHLRNIVLLDGKPTLFDAIEFNDAIACIDVFYDLAFLLMDLDHRGLRPFANLVLNRYLQQRGDVEGLALLPLFLSARAAVRAKVAASLEAVAGAAPEKSHRRAEAEAYFRRAGAYLAPGEPRLVAIGGLSGTGKTTLARALAPLLGRAPGALHLRSDILRKRLAGVPENQRLPAASYTQAASDEVYAAMQEVAAAALAAGQAVIVDAVFARPRERAAAARIARDAGAAFTGLWLEADPAVMVERVSARHGDASDADRAVVEKQLTYDVGSVEWRRLDASTAFSRLRAEAARILNLAADA
ncbi:MAG: AAA family ATPase [Kiloniellaceae bacterium]